jgi:hypothetical protein
VAVSSIDAVEAAFYPTPFSDNLNLNYIADEKTAVAIIDMQGKVLKTIVLEPYSTTHTLPVSDLPRGVYIAKIKSSGRSIVKKIIKTVI